MKELLDRKNFRKEWASPVVFLLMIGLVPFGTAIPVETRTQGILLTIGLSLVTGGVAVVFLRHESVTLKDVGLGKSA